MQWRRHLECSSHTHKVCTISIAKSIQIKISDERWNVDGTKNIHLFATLYSFLFGLARAVEEYTFRNMQSINSHYLNLNTKFSVELALGFLYSIEWFVFSTNSHKWFSTRVHAAMKLSPSQSHSSHSLPIQIWIVIVWIYNRRIGIWVTDCLYHTYRSRLTIIM